MEMFEKVEKLKERANVTFEEAKEALDACGGDLLDAMVYLEKQGKVIQPQQSTFSTSYEQQDKFTSVEETVKSQQKKSDVGASIRGAIHTFFEKCRGNFFCIKKNDEVRFKIPVLGFIILTIAFWQVVLPAMVILLFFGCHFSFYGKDELKEANDIMNKASDIAQQVKNGFSDSFAKKDNNDNTSETETESADEVQE